MWGGKTWRAVLWVWTLHLKQVQIRSVTQSCPTLCDESQHARPPCDGTNSRSSLILTSIESVMPSSHLILCRPLLLLPPIPPSIRVLSNEQVQKIKIILITLKPYYFFFHCVDIDCDVAKPTMNKAAGASAQIKMAEAKCKDNYLLDSSTQSLHYCWLWQVS